MTLYIHKVTKKFYDYREYLETEHGIAWSSSGRAEDARGFEVCNDFEAKLQAKRAIIAKHTTPGTELVELKVGEQVHRSVNLNPHGLM